MYCESIIYSQEGYFLDTIYHNGTFYRNDRTTNWMLSLDVLYWHSYRGGTITHCEHTERKGLWYVSKGNTGIVFSKDMIFCLPEYKQYVIIGDGCIIMDDVILPLLEYIISIDKVSHYGKWLVFSSGLSCFVRLNIEEKKIYTYPRSSSHIASFDNKDWFRENQYLIDLNNDKKIHVGDDELKYAGNGRIMRYKDGITEVFTYFKIFTIKRVFIDALIYCHEQD